MSDRNSDEKPYSAEESRIAAFFAERGTGGGHDPVGSILSGYSYLIEERNKLRAALAEIDCYAGHVHLSLRPESAAAINSSRNTSYIFFAA